MANRSFSRMGPTLLYIISITGLFAPQLQTTSVEFLYKGIGTFFESQNVCTQRNGTLAAFEDKIENDNVLNNFSSNEDFWIGLYDNMSSWTWSLDGAAFDNGLDFSSWGNLQPDLSVEGKICVHMTEYGEWFDATCTLTQPAVCYYDPGPAQYILVTTPMTWERAQEYCRYNYTDLASVRNLTENGNISTLLTEASWIGLFREGWEQWSDQTPHNFTNFRSEDSNYYTSTADLVCARASTTTGLWSKVSCELNSNILCRVNVEDDPVPVTTAQTTVETAGSGSAGHSNGNGSQASAQTTSAVPDVVPPQAKNTLKLRLQSDTDLNDPRIKDGILQEDNFDNHELGELKLHWLQVDGEVFHKETPTKEKRDCQR